MNAQRPSLVVLRDHKEPGGVSDTSPVALLRDEATDLLLGRLEAEPCGSLTIHVEHGTYLAEYDGVENLTGVWMPNLTDALNSLIGRICDVR